MAKPSHISDKIVYRSLDNAGAGSSIDVEARTATLTFASDFAVERYDWLEVLDMSGMSTERIGSGRAALLVEHNRADHVGVITNVTLADGVWRATVKFSRSLRGEEIFQDVIDGIRTLVSVGYSIDEVVLDSADESGRTYRVARWTPHEISIVSIPADPTVGVGRALPSLTAENAPLAVVLPVQIRSQNNNNTKEAKMDEKDPIVVERTRVNEIIALGAKHKADKVAREFIANGKSIDEFRAVLLETRPEAQAVRSAKIGMNDKEVGQYSILRAMNAQITSDWRSAPLEREVSLAVEKATKKTARGFLVASDVLTRAVTSSHNVTNFADGGALVATDLRTESFIDALRNRTILNSLGATILTDAEGPIAIPKEVGMMGVTWVGEDGVAVETKAQFGQVAMSPKTVLAKTSISRRLMLQSAISIENFVRDRFQKAIALALDHAALVGGSTPQEPKGILSLLPASQRLLATGNAYEDAVALETMVAAENADIGSLAYVGNARTRGALKIAQVFEGAGKAVWGDSLIPGVGMVNGYNAYATNHITGSSPLMFGNFASLFVAFWSGLDVVVDTITSDSGAHIVKVYQDADVAIAHTESFAALED